MKRGPPLRLDVTLSDLEAINPQQRAIGTCVNQLSNPENALITRQDVEEERKGSVENHNAGNVDPNTRNDAQPQSTLSKACLVLKDDGPGISPYKMRTLLTQFGQDNLRSYQSGPFDLAEHGIGLKLASLRLGKNCLILSKTSPQAQIGVQYFSVALFSVDFVKKENTPFFAAPLLSFTIRDKQSFHELTGLTSQMFAQIKKHFALSKFASMDQLMDYALNEIGAHGTHIYITDLKQQSNNQG